MAISVTRDIGPIVFRVTATCDKCHSRRFLASRPPSNSLDEAAEPLDEAAEPLDDEGWLLIEGRPMLCRPCRVEVQG